MFVQDGKNLEYPCTAAVAREDVLKVNDTFGIAATDGAIGDVITVYTEGVFTLAADSTAAITQGSTVYWDATNKKVLAAQTASEPAIGKAWAAKVADGTTVDVKINA